MAAHVNVMRYSGYAWMSLNTMNMVGLDVLSATLSNRSAAFPEFFAGGMMMPLLPRVKSPTKTLARYMRLWPLASGLA